MTIATPGLPYAPLPHAATGLLSPRALTVLAALQQWFRPNRARISREDQEIARACGKSVAFVQRGLRELSRVVGPHGLPFIARIRRRGGRVIERLYALAGRPADQCIDQKRRTQSSKATGPPEEGKNGVKTPAVVGPAPGGGPPSTPAGERAEADGPATAAELAALKAKLLAPHGPAPARPAAGPAQAPGPAPEPGDHSARLKAFDAMRAARAQSQGPSGPCAAADPPALTPKASDDLFDPAPHAPPVAGRGVAGWVRPLVERLKGANNRPPGPSSQL